MRIPFSVKLKWIHLKSILKERVAQAGREREKGEGFKASRREIPGRGFPLVVLIMIFITSSCGGVDPGRRMGETAVEQMPVTLESSQGQAPETASVETTVQPGDLPGAPYCNPPGTGLWLVPSSTLVPIGDEFEVDLILMNHEISEAFMGQVQYRLDVSQNLTLMDRDPLVSTLTLYPGDAERVTFRLRGGSEGDGEVRAIASYELHALDLSWGSWSGCYSHPLEIEVVTGVVGTGTDELAVPVHDPSTRTAIAEIDRVLDAVLARDPAALRDLIELTETSCTEAEGLGGPPKCLEGETEGDPVEVLPFLGPEGHFLRKDQLGSWKGPTIKGLYAAYRPTADAYTDPDYPVGEYALVFLHGHGIAFVTYQVAGGRIVRIDYEFGVPPGDRLLQNAGELILPPPGQ